MVGTFLTKLFKRDPVLSPTPAVSLDFTDEDSDMDGSGSLYARASVHIERPSARSSAEKPRLMGALMNKTRRLLGRDENMATIENAAGIYEDEITRIRAIRY